MRIAVSLLLLILYGLWMNAAAGAATAADGIQMLLEKTKVPPGGDGSGAP